MIGKNTIKLIKSLSAKKFRLKEKLFLAEGNKIVTEVLVSGFKVEKLFATSEFLSENKTLTKNALQVFEVGEKEIHQASLLKSPQDCIALCTLPDYGTPLHLPEGLSVYLDDVQDPGNLGTIIRICDWFGIENLFCSPNSADAFNPKVIQASMGSFCRVKILQETSERVVSLAKKSGTPIFGAFLNGENIYEKNLPENAVLVMGNEGNGIQPDLEKLIEHKIKIPGYTMKETGPESLNVSVATAIICAEFKRQAHFGTYSK